MWVNTHTHTDPQHIHTQLKVQIYLQEENSSLTFACEARIITWNLKTISKQSC